MSKRKPRGHWTWDNTKSKLEEIAEELGHFPTARELTALGLSGLVDAVNKRYGGFRELREKLGRDQLRRPRGYFKEWDNVEKELFQVEAKLGHFPSDIELRDLGLSSLANAISNYYGGYTEVRKRLGKPQTSDLIEMLKDWKTLENKINQLEAELGHFPTQQDLRNLGIVYIHTAMKKHYGGPNKVKRKLGKKSQRDPNYLKDWSNVKSEILQLEAALGHFPTAKEMVALGYSSLPDAICKYHRGFNNVQKKLSRKQTTVQWSKIIKTTDDAVRYYEENYAGMSRSEVQKNTENGGRAFYKAILKRKWLDDVFPPSKTKTSQQDNEAKRKQLEELLRTYVGDKGISTEDN